MKPKQVMIIAGEPSGDLLAAELVAALREEFISAASAPTRDAQPLRTGLEPRFFGAGGPRMKAAGVEVAFDLTQHAVTGGDVLKKILQLRKPFQQLRRLAIERQPDVVIGVDYGMFNLRFARSIRRYARSHSDWFHAWQPKIVQYVSPQVWGSRPGRADRMARDHDLILSIFPFEPAWYARRTPNLKVKFVGHPMVQRFANSKSLVNRSETSPNRKKVLILPGSRPGELRRHLPVVLDALKQMRSQEPALESKMVLPNESLVQLAKAFGTPSDVTIQVGGLAEALLHADIAIASTGTVTMECAYFGVPTVALYKTTWAMYRYGLWIATVRSLTMPNLMANEELFPEFIQYAATPENISRAALELIRDEPRRARIKKRLSEIIASLGGPGASRRAAQAIVELG